MASPIPAWKKPERPSYPVVLFGKVYVASGKPGEPGYVLRPAEDGEAPEVSA